MVILCGALEEMAHLEHFAVGALWTDELDAKRLSLGVESRRDADCGQTR